jgi:hypothetical protein
VLRFFKTPGGHRYFVRGVGITEHAAAFFSLSGTNLPTEKVRFNMRPGRKSAASLSVVPIDPNRPLPRPTPLKRLTPRERQTFDLACAQNPHLRASDTALLTPYAMCVARLVSGKVRDIADIERLCRTVMALARSLRLTAQSRIGPRSVGRAQPVNNKFPWDPDLNPEPDDAG